MECDITIPNLLQRMQAIIIFVVVLTNSFGPAQSAHPLGKHGAEDSQAAWRLSRREGQEPPGAGVDGWAPGSGQEDAYALTSCKLPPHSTTSSADSIRPCAAGSREITQRLLLPFTWAAFIRIAESFHPAGKAG